MSSSNSTLGLERFLERASSRAMIMNNARVSGVRLAAVFDAAREEVHESGEVSDSVTDSITQLAAAFLGEALPK